MSQIRAILFLVICLITCMVWSQARHDRFIMTTNERGRVNSDDEPCTQFGEILFEGDNECEVQVVRPPLYGVKDAWVDAGALTDYGHFLGCFSEFEGIGNNLGIEYAWSRGYFGSEDFVIAIVDTGINGTHYALNNAIWINKDEIYGNGIDDDGNGYVDDRFGYDFFYDTPNSDTLYHVDNSTHATEISMVITSKYNDYGPISEGIESEVDSVFDTSNQPGICRDCKLMNVKVWGTGNSKAFMAQKRAEGIKYAVDNGAKVIVLAVGESGVSDPSEPFEFTSEQLDNLFKVRKDDEWDEALEYAWSNNVLVVGSSGNKSSFSEGTIQRGEYDPLTNHPSVIQVGGLLNGAYSVNELSYEGSSVDVMAPFSVGLSVNFMDLNRKGGGCCGSATVGGTSFSCSLVAGLIGVFWSEFPELSAAQVKKRLIESARDELIKLPENGNLFFNLLSDDIRSYTDEELDDVCGTIWAVRNDPPGRDDFYGYGAVSLESLFEGVQNRTIELDLKTGSVNGYEQPTRAKLEHFNKSFQDWYNLVLSVNESSTEIDNAFIYPNPVRSILKINLPKGSYSYAIFTLAGKRMLNDVYDPNKGVDVSEFKAGTYIMEIKNGKLCKENLRFLKH